ncbi:hypothetical protein CRENBAI_009179 [Crenichthys baileyi]|uniref:Uncharacterized protein n=1 Tax=Crenichthys baileyi TaxID=28760 RepID=A0AAV9SKS8_9TELE
MEHDTTQRWTGEEEVPMSTAGTAVSHAFVCHSTVSQARCGSFHAVFARSSPGFRGNTRQAGGAIEVFCWAEQGLQEDQSLPSFSSAEGQIEGDEAGILDSGKAVLRLRFPEGCCSPAHAMPLE